MRTIRLKDTYDLTRIKSFLENNSNCNIILIANGREQSELYWSRIKQHLKIKTRPFIITNHEHSVDGLPFHDSLILKIGRWWENKSAKHVMLNNGLAKLTLPITYIPPFIERR